MKLYTDHEKKFIELLSERFSTECQSITFECIKYQLKITGVYLHEIIRTLRDDGLFSEVSGQDKDGEVYCLKAHPKAVETAREIRAEREAEPSPPDLVDRIIKKARSHEVIAWVIVIFYAVAPVAGLIISLIALFKK